MNLVPCPCCGLLEDWPENPLKPYCSEVCRLLWRHGLAWRVQPCRIVVGSHPHLLVQNGPVFDLSDQALKGARERVLATERKRRQRTHSAGLRNVTPKAQLDASVGGDVSLWEVENVG